MDLAEAHVAAVEHLGAMAGGAVLPLNVGTGRGHSVLEVVQAFEEASGQRIPRVMEGRRPGDIAQVWANPARATAILGWAARRSLEEMCADAWRWQHANPNGYLSATP